MMTRTGLAAMLALAITLLLCPPSLADLRAADSAVVAAEVVVTLVKFAIFFAAFRAGLGVLGRGSGGSAGGRP